MKPRLFIGSSVESLNIAEASKHNGFLDIKTDGFYAPDGPMTGKLLNGYYATARSAGNFLAGNLGKLGSLAGFNVTRDTYMKLVGAYQVLNKMNVIIAAPIVAFGTSYGPAPYYGEDSYLGRMILNGWDNGYKVWNH